MLKITLKLYPAEWQAMVRFCPTYQDLQLSSPKSLDAKLILLAEFRGKITPTSVLAWSYRRDNHEFSCRLPVSLVKALWDYMQHQPLSTIDQLLLNKLDRSLTDFKLPKI